MQKEIKGSAMAFKPDIQITKDKNPSSLNMKKEPNH